jgi:hypothetical protein
VVPAALCRGLARRTNAPIWARGLSDWARAFWQPLLGGERMHLQKPSRSAYLRPLGTSMRNDWCGVACPLPSHTHPPHTHAPVARLVTSHRSVSPYDSSSALVTHISRRVCYTSQTTTRLSLCWMANRLGLSE